MESLKTGSIKEVELDEYDLKSLAEIPFSEATETVSLFNNEIENPNEVVQYLLPLSGLKALWLNGNPVVDTCVNF